MIQFYKYFMVAFMTWAITTLVYFANPFLLLAVVATITGERLN